MSYQRYTELDVWKKARALTTVIYKLTCFFPKAEQLGITAQIRKSAVSIPSNIAEGCGRQHKKETVQFLSIARGSLFELETQIYIAKDLSFITDEQLKSCLEDIEDLGKLINGFIRYFNSIK